MAQPSPRRPLPRRYLSAATLAVAMASPLAWGETIASVTFFQFHQPNVLGTAMDLTVFAPTEADARAAEQAIHAEIDRLKKILSTYDAGSELAQLNAAAINGPGLHVSDELIDVLQRYDTWAKRTRGAFTGHVANLSAVWKKAEQAGQLPTDAELKAAADAAALAAWEINPAEKTVRRVSDQLIDVNSVGKGYVIDKAVAAAIAASPKVTGLMLSIGGDVRVWGKPSGVASGLWAIGIQDPAHPELNATPMATVYVPGGTSVSTSGAYQRFYTISGKEYSHILDARTGQPGRNPSATVVAADSATANALATIGCVLRFAETMQLVRAVPNAEAMIITPDGNPIRSDGFKELVDQNAAAERFAPRVASQFPAGYKMTINLNLPAMRRRPYVFAWVTDSQGKHVKTLAAYGNEQKWLKEMKEWWKMAASDKKLLAITHATQAAGAYPLMWDGTNQKGSGVPLGKYNIWVEVGAEDGPYSAKFASIELGPKPATAKINKSAAFNEVAIAYGPAAAAGAVR